jgi:hypothetical protein
MLNLTSEFGVQVGMVCVVHKCEQNNSCMSSHLHTIFSQEGWGLGLVLSVCQDTARHPQKHSWPVFCVMFEHTHKHTITLLCRMPHAC